VCAITLRSLEKLPEVDSLIDATAIRYNIDYFYTFDEDFTHLNNRKIQNTVIIKL
jgi:predicted nucleic acid-binding protein